MAETLDQTNQQMVPFCGKWHLEECSNFDAFLKECGINAILRKVAGALTPTEVIERDACQSEKVVWVIRTETIVKKVSAKFVLGEAFKEKTIDDRHVDSIITVEPVKDEEDNDETEVSALVNRQKDKEGRLITIIRTISARDSRMKVKMSVNDVQARATFKKL